MELASERSISQITVADLAERAEVTRATFYNHYVSPLELLIEMPFIPRCTHPDLPDTNHHVIARFVAHGFAGAIKAWLTDDSMTQEDLVDAAVACAPVWWG